MKNPTAHIDWSNRNEWGNPRRAPVPRHRIPWGPLCVDADPIPLYVKDIPPRKGLGFGEARMRLEVTGIFPALAELAATSICLDDEKTVRAVVRKVSRAETVWGDRYVNPAMQAAALSLVRDMRPELWELWNGHGT